MHRTHRVTPEHDFRDLKQKVSVEHVLADQGVLDRFRRRGDRLVGPCPLHGGDNPRAFVVSLSKNGWFCFSGCASGGDVVELARRFCGDYAAAARYLACLANQPPQLPPLHHRHQPREFRPFRKRLQLHPDVPFLRSKRIEPATARRFEVGAYRGPGFLQGCIGVRLHDPQGHPLGYAGRRLDPGSADNLGKWKCPTGLPKSKLLYGFHRAAPKLHIELFVVECPWGAHRLAQLGFPAVALLGTHLSNAQERLLRHAKRLTIMMDGDAAGRKAAAQIRRRLRDLDLAIVNLPDGHDPDDLDDGRLFRAVRLLPL